MPRFLTTSRAKYALLLLSLLALLLLLQQSPVDHGEWRQQQAFMPEIRIQGDQILVSLLRDFRYHPDGRIRHARYREQEYRLSALSGVWLGISHFAGNGMAHTFLSFEFADGEYLIASVEARMRPGQEYHPVAGMLRQYHKTIVLGTEQDIIGLRSHIRGERVLLYPLQLNDTQRRHMLLGILEDARALQQQPAYYHTLLDNCTTSLLRHDPQHSPWKALTDYRLLLPGHSDAYAVERGWLTNDRLLPQLRREALIDATVSPDADDFSLQIRRPAYQQLSLSLLVMQATQYHGSAVRSEGVVRGFDDPGHYWVEDARLNRVALHPAEQAQKWVGQPVSVAGRFYYHPDEGRRIELDSIRAAP